MLDDHPNARFMQFKVFTKRKRFPHQICTPLPQCVIQSLDMLGFTGSFWHWTMAFGRKDTWIDAPFIRGENRAPPLISRERLPEFAACLRRTIAKGKTNDLACLTLNRHPYPY